MDKFYIVINGASVNSWSAWVWSDIQNTASIFYDNTTLTSNLLCKMKKIHFGNKLNRKIWIPFKSIWDKSLCIQIGDLDVVNRNFIIFQSTVKFSSSHIQKLKKEKNSVIVLYLPDTIKNLGIANTRDEFERYRKYYDIDLVYSFDKKDCEQYKLNFFDIYSSKSYENLTTDFETDLFYVGTCRNEQRYHTLLSVFERAVTKIKVLFFFVGVSSEKQKYKNEIIYNKYLDYKEVVDYTMKSRCVLEIMNENQVGNTLRFKEAVCYNKKIITNNRQVLKSVYYNPEWIQYFEKIEDIDFNWILKGNRVDFRYEGEFSPLRLIEMLRKYKNNE